MIEGNNLTTFALVLFPVLAYVAFTRKRLEEATVACIFGATLFLPERASFDPPLIPKLDKHSIAALSLYVALWLSARPRLSRANALSGAGTWITVLLLGVVGTCLSNMDPVTHGLSTSPGLTPYDAVSWALASILKFALPFIVGRAVFRDPRALQVLATALVGWALLYTVLALIEIRLSPQLHNWIYGYMQHAFAQTARGGGYRPMVFMQHGLAVSIFFASAAICALGMRSAVRRVWKFTAAKAAIYLYGVLVLCHSFGALILATAGLLVVRFLTPRNQIRIAALLGIIVFVYPMLRFTGAVPTETLVDWAQSLGDDDRARSLQFRFDNEDALMERAWERPMLGWGGSGRGAAYDDLGQPTSIPDASWVILLSTRGLLGCAAAFGLLTFPLITVGRRFRTISAPSDRTLMAALAVALAFSIADLLVNGLYTTIPLYIGGALLGLLDGLPAARRRQAAAAAGQRRAAVGT